MEENKNTESQATGTDDNALIDYEAKYKELMVDNAKLKKALDKSASETAGFKKQLREKQSADEIAAQEKAEKEAARAEKEAEREEQFKQLLRENNINKLEKSYLAMGYTSDEASRMAIAEADGDFESRIKIMQEVDARKKKDYESEWLKSRPSINVGVDETTTSKTNTDSYLDLVSLKHSNPSEYKKIFN